MTPIRTIRGQFVGEVLSELPAALGFVCVLVSDGKFELRSHRCTIEFIFDRYEALMFTVLIMIPGEGADLARTFSLFALQHMRSVPNSSRSETSAGKSIGRMLTESFADLLAGDVTRMIDYEQFERRMFDLLFDVWALPDGHPTRLRFEKFDRRWIDEFDVERH